MTSFDTIGNKDKSVAIIEESNSNEEKNFAREILKKHPNIKTVLKKTSERKGKYRNREYKFVAGIKNTEVIHREHGFLLKLNPRYTYFSPREATERQRIATKVNSDEDILIMFSGICPFGIAIEKKQPDVKRICCVEINPKAHEYAEENLKLNKTKKIKLYSGDVKEILPKIKNKFDRIIMPLPKKGYSYLDLALNKTKKKGMIYFYYWANESDLFSEAVKIVREEARKSNKKIKIIDKRKVLPYGPRIWKIRLDILVN
ncbi:methyltransferase [Candidatus Woesearchaeota archaeon]|nr:methyltransferase [Candidatus Woesearchaeota archaeon]